MSKKSLFRTSRGVVAVAAAMVAAGCAVKPEKAPSPPVPRAPASLQCQAARAGDEAIGNWYGTRSQRGVAGTLHVLIHLRADGTMSYDEQLKRGKKPGQALGETGCWHRDQQGLVLQTAKSNGEPVELSDPIYKNHYTVRYQPPQTMVFDGRDGRLKARRMPENYRLPF